jgi:hypothetical protein
MITRLNYIYAIYFYVLNFNSLPDLAKPIHMNSPGSESLKHLEQYVFPPYEFILMILFV